MHTERIVFGISMEWGTGLVGRQAAGQVMCVWFYPGKYHGTSWAIFWPCVRLIISLNLFLSDKKSCYTYELLIPSHRLAAK